MPRCGAVVLHIASTPWAITELRSFRFDVRGLDHCGPLVYLGLLERRKLVGKVMPEPVTPICSSRCFTSGERRMVAISFCKRCSTGLGVPARAKTPC